MSGTKIVVAAGMLLYRRPSWGGIQILTGRRRKPPWQGFRLLAFGGQVKEMDEDTFQAALREAREETGKGLTIKVPYNFPIGTFGPRSFHHILRPGPDGIPEAVKTSHEIIWDGKRFCTTFYAGEIIRGSPVENEEVVDFDFVNPEVLAQSCTPCAFDQALILVEFLRLYRWGIPFPNENILRGIVTPAV